MGVLWVDVDGAATANLLLWDGSVVTCWCPAWRVTPWHLGATSTSFPFLPFQIFQGDGHILRVVELVRHYSDTDSGKVRVKRSRIDFCGSLGFLSEDGMVRQWRATTLVGTARELVSFLYGGDRTALERHEFLQLIYYWQTRNRMTRHEFHLRNYLGCLLFPERTKRRRQPSAGELKEILY